MRLLKYDSASKLSLTNFDGDIPPYAILSHTWGRDEDEISLHDLRVQCYKSKLGYNKIQFCGEQAMKDGLEYFWVDTCCIDRSSSAELSELINSIFRRYENSAVCYVYLADVSSGDDSDKYTMYKSRWFTRQPTLPELILPRMVKFFSREGTFIGSKWDLVDLLTDVTGIPSSIFTNSGQSMTPTRLARYSIAERMSWAAQRLTSRIEDMAYFLIWLFDVNMLALYGEGDKAFLRLQRKIIKQTTDQSILAWGLQRGNDSTNAIELLPVFARGPADFYRSGGGKTDRIITLPEAGRRVNYRFTYSNIGLILWRPLVETLSSHLTFAVLNCVCDHGDGSTSAIWVPLWKSGRDSYYRIALPSATLYVRGVNPDVLMPSSEICLEDPPDRGTSYIHPNFLRLTSRSSEVNEAEFGVLVSFPAGMQSFKNTASYPERDRNPLGLIWLKSRGDGYHHGLLIFERTSGAEKRKIGVLLAVANIPARWTCRILNDIDDAVSPDSLASRSSAELAKICNEDAESQLPRSFESTLWRLKEQSGVTVIHLDQAPAKASDAESTMLMIRVVFDYPTTNNLSGLISTTFRKSQISHKSLAPLETWGQIRDQGPVAMGAF